MIETDKKPKRGRPRRVDAVNITDRLLSFIATQYKVISDWKKMLAEKEDTMPEEKFKDQLHMLWISERGLLDLNDILMEELQKFLGEKAGKKEDDDGWRDLRWVSEYTGIKYTTIRVYASPAYRAASERPIPVHKINGRLLTKKSMIDKWILSEE